MSKNDSAPNAQITPIANTRWKRHGKVLLAAIAALMALTYVTLQWLVELPPASGHQHVGQRSLVFTDADRIDPWSRRAPREILVYAFFPAAKPGSRVSYFPELARLAKNFEGTDSLLVRLLPIFLTPSATDGTELAATEEKLPVVLFSPGAYAAVFTYRTLLEDLASHGYLVLAIEATHEGVGQVFPDGHVCEPLANQFQPASDHPAEIEAFYRQRVATRADDLSFVARQLGDDSLKSVWPAGVGRIDSDHISALGHSLGGVAAVEAARKEPRIVATINLDGHFKDFPCLPDELPTAKHSAILVIEDESPIVRDSEAASGDGELAEARVKWQKRQTEIDAQLARTFRRQEKVLLTDTRHSDFSDEPFFYPHWRRADWNRDLQRLQTIRESARSFLDRERGRPN